MCEFMMHKIQCLFDESLTNDDAFVVCATVDTGFEWQAIDEHREKISNASEAIKERGRIYFNLQWDQYEKVQEMRSIDNIFIVADVQTVTFHKTNKEADLQLFKDIVHKHMNLNKGLDIWKRATCFMGKLYPTLEEYNSAKNQTSVTEEKENEKEEENDKDKEKEKKEEGGKEKDKEREKGEDKEKEKEKDKDQEKEKESKTTRGRKRGVDPSESKENDIVRYRVTCERSGEHTFKSIDVAFVIGGELQTKYHWLVDLSKYHLEIICKLTEQQLITLLRVTHESKHRRNIVSFGPTTLRSTICYNLLRLANPKPGDIIIDPMCGSGSIPIEAALAFSNLCILCGDKSSKALERTKSNIDASVTKAKINPIQWMTSQLPLKDSFVDIIVADMPFGKRSGRKSDNERLYKQVLLELGRVVKLSSGRLVLLTHDRKSFTHALKAAGDMFQLMRLINVKIGGLQVIAYVLKRTNVHFTHFKSQYY